MLKTIITKQVFYTINDKLMFSEASKRTGSINVDNHGGVIKKNCFYYNVRHRQIKHQHQETGQDDDGV